MKINHKILSVPPYVSTSWKNVISLHVEGSSLFIDLINGTQIEIPQLNASLFETIFAAHARFLEQEASPKNASKSASTNPPIISETILAMGLPPIKIGNGGLEQLGNALQHNPDQSDAPDLPQEILHKVSTFIKAIGIDDPHLLPKAEPHCNCFHCQIAKAIQGEGATVRESLSTEEEVSAEDLKFRSWDVDEQSQNLYLVTNPLDKKEYYNVYLGDPIGCTCGHKNCEHIRAVLNS